MGADGEAAKLDLLFSAISGMYGLLRLGAAVVQARGWDMRPIGNLALVCLGLQVIEMALLASYQSAAGIPTAHFAFIEIALGLYVLVLAGFWAVTHGRINARPVGLACLLAVVGTLYIRSTAEDCSRHPAPEPGRRGWDVRPRSVAGDHLTAAEPRLARTRDWISQACRSWPP